MKKGIIIISVLIILLVPFFCYQSKKLEVTEYTFSSQKIGDGLNGFTIVQLSDLHNASFGKDNKNLISKVKALSPDIVVITGDLNYSDRANIRSGLQIISALSETVPVYYVTGNHEYFIEDSDLRGELFKSITDAGAIYLDNESVDIKKGKESFLLTGLDDNSLGDETLSNLIKGTKEMTVALAHEPQYIRRYADSGVDLVLTGHAHGGQIRLPFIGAVIAPDQGFFPEYTSGEHICGNTKMIISRGLGSSIIPLRLFNYPEIVCVKLKIE